MFIAHHYSATTVPRRPVIAWFTLSRAARELHVVMPDKRVPKCGLPKRRNPLCAALARYVAMSDCELETCDSSFLPSIRPSMYVCLSAYLTVGLTIGLFAMSESVAGR